MTINLLPIVGRELRVASRRKVTFFVRCVAPLIVFLIGAWFFLITPFMPPAAVAKGMFGILGGTALLYAFVSGAYFTADSLSEEKREGTLGLLFLTDLKGYDVVLGKLAATSLGAFYGLLAMLPMLSVPLLIGGVSYSEVLRISLVVVNTMFLSLTAGLFISSVTRAPRISSGLTLLLLAGFAFILPGIVAVIYSYLRVGWTNYGWWWIASPGYAFYSGFDTVYGVKPEGYWYSMGTIHFLGWIYLTLASLVAPRAWKDKPIGTRQSLRDRIIGWSYGSGAEREAHRKALLDVNPFFWLASRSRTKPAQVWCMLAVAAAFWIWGWLENGSNWLDEGLFVATALVLNVLIKGWFANECTRQIAEDRNRGALELILCTPLSVEEILHGQRLALQRQFLGPTVFVLALYVVMMFATVGEVRGEESTMWVWMWMMNIVIFVMDLIALYWIGLWLAVSKKKVNHASSHAALLVLAVPWVMFGIVMAVVVSMAVRMQTNPEEDLLLAVWAVTAIGMDMLFISYARGMIRQHFRRVAMRVGRS